MIVDFRLSEEDQDKARSEYSNRFGASMTDPSKKVFMPKDNAVENAAFAAYRLAIPVGTAIGAYHGYKRNSSVGWAVAWGLLGGVFPMFTIPIAYAQGLGKRK